MLTAFARLVRERPAGSASVVMACTVDEEFTHTGSSRPGRRPPRGRPGDRRRADAARHRRPPQGGGPLEGPDPGRRLPHLDAAPRRERDLHDGPGGRGASRITPASSPRSTPDPVLGPPSLSVGRIEGGRASTSCPTGAEIEIDRRVDPRRAARRLPGAGPATSSASGSATLDGVEFLPPWVNMPPLVAGPGRAVRSPRSGRRSSGSAAGRPRSMGVPYGTDAGPLGEAGAAVLRLRAGRHRPGPHQGRVGRAGPGPARLGDVFRDRPASWAGPADRPAFESGPGPASMRRALGCSSAVGCAPDAQKTSRIEVVALVDTSACSRGGWAVGVVLDAELRCPAVVVAVERPLDLRDDPLLLGVEVPAVVEGLVFEARCRGSGAGRRASAGSRTNPGPWPRRPRRGRSGRPTGPGT